ncbi:hypothetical protein RND71_015134 [Anisodus tanguticus]|uniref:Nodal modulator 3 n=1 Tax=Anisodus tanguticus TaxID=243964 RepID=A0AAE1VNE0_9SOLA|nr:hypothetical protein RND71_015134 [Anisodus tanguticus]
MAMASSYYYLFFTVILIIVYVSATATVTADSIQGCGGFVEASSELIKSRKSSDPKLDYSNIIVELRTLDGLVKERTHCAPNGYYFIPVYDKGSFLIKVNGPEGWSWDPEQVPAVIDHTGCNGNEDINFRFTGFTVSGRIVGNVGGESCSQKDGGPSNVNVELLSPTGDVVSSALSKPRGTYSFTNTIPGKYKLRASRHDLNVQVRGSAEIELDFENRIVDDFFFIPGYDIRGSVVAQGNAILGVHIYLYSDDVTKVDCPKGSKNSPGELGLGEALCHNVTDSNGIFSLKSIPCGVYKLIPFYKGENTVFDVSPSSTSISIQHDHVIVPEKFQVTGFSVGGRVVDGDGNGIEGVEILVDGQKRSITDKEGYYKLDQNVFSIRVFSEVVYMVKVNISDCAFKLCVLPGVVTSKRYTIEAKKVHYRFDRLIDFLVLPNMASISDIKAASYDLCGLVQTVSSEFKAKVALTHGPQNVKPQVKLTDESGHFCFEVPPGEYRLSAIPAKLENAKELIFSPSHIDVSVRSPLLDVKFYQAQVSVHGSVVCKEKCGSSVSLTLLRLDGRNKDDKKTTGLANESNEFFFSNVLPGKYRVEVKNNYPIASSGEDKWCWEQSFINLEVGAEDVKGVDFVQKGFWVNIISSHDVDGLLTQPDGSIMNLNIKKGSQHVCVESPGVHELGFPNSCISFGSSSVIIDTSNLSPIYLKGESYLLKGHVHVESSSFSSVEGLPENIPLDILDSEGSVVGGLTARRVPFGVDQSSAAVYEFSMWASPGGKITFVPRDARDDGGKKILFYPTQQHVAVMQDGCQSLIPPFAGRLGLYIEGSVSPPLDDVVVKIIAAGDSQSAPLKQGDLALETTTGTDGLFVTGPLYDDISYSVEASKPGYHVKQVGPHSFSCQKLGQISVRIYSREDANEPFPSVLLSLSGEDGYRNNTVSGVGGIFVFGDLFPGSFYLRPLLKEYAFSPPAEAIELGSGESKEVVFHATRVAYSAMGVVTLLSGQPKEGVSVEARAESKGFYEETVTDSTGFYRLRGLLPDTTYVIKVARKVANGGTTIERASPESLTVQVRAEDSKGLDFVVFEQPERTVLSGHVEGHRIKEFNSHLHVEIKSAADPLKIEYNFPLPLSNFFQVKNLPKGKHFVQLRSSLPSSTHRFESDVIEVDLEKHSQIHVGPLKYKIDFNHHKQDLTPAPKYPLFVGVSVIALFIGMPRLRDLYQVMMGMSTSVSAKKDVKRAVVRKKTY